MLYWGHTLFQTDCAFHAFIHCYKLHFVDWVNADSCDFCLKSIMSEWYCNWLGVNGLQVFFFDTVRNGEEGCVRLWCSENLWRQKWICLKRETLRSKYAASWRSDKMGPGRLSRRRQLDMLWHSNVVAPQRGSVIISRRMLDFGAFWWVCSSSFYSFLVFFYSYFISGNVQESERILLKFIK